MLVSLGLITDCTGWTVLGYEFDKEEEEFGFIEILDQDSIRHYYKDFRVDKDNWCIEHGQFEYVEKKEYGFLD